MKTRNKLFTAGDFYVYEYNGEGGIDFFIGHKDCPSSSGKTCIEGLTSSYYCGNCLESCTIDEYAKLHDALELIKGTLLVA